MNSATATAELRRPTDWKGSAMQNRIRRRYAAERRFKLLGLLSILVSAAFLAFLLVTMIGNGARGFTQTEIRLPVDFPRSSLMLDPAALAGFGADAALAGADIEGTTAAAADAAFGAGGARLLSDGAWLSVRDAIKRDPAILRGKAEIWVPAATAIDLAAKGNAAPAAEAAYGKLQKADVVRTGFNWTFLTRADSTDPTLVGIWGALKGSLVTMFVTLVLAFPVGVFAALYLEEYAPRNRWTDLIEVSINNLAAVPSIIFGLLGLAVFLNFMHLPRSAPLVGGLTLALMTMPVIVIAGRNAIKAVPPSIRDAALGIGASRVQVVFHHVLPLALPGILTGTIIGMARALGETAPLLMIGMRAFLASPPGGIMDPATVLPVQIFLWSDEVSRGFVEKTSAAIIVLLVFLLAMNGVAIYLRNRFERRW
ncbi:MULTISPECIES: phosphate ABC transporter permease PstA [Sphingomonadales]|uniref:Phosphate transport system permease protein PstA n=2 Tax=Edaphosphingomonas TaxID=3423724 RepID=A0A2T4HU98_9SPHN|nr:MULTISPECIES: phosphate ABC transporter permease PstA [Sphingomonas]AGH48032.1 phosphate ABC transporter permease [Sphingomonas sp. MM-1]MDX3884963.1 phosphate ABC transporter permease PstA [Sphingomonas sp.]OHT20431.1 Phosphate transport system permease protein PstA [Sphingomonas haloaromaticamans]PTD19365.1 phosphate ABC transporter, permease protein PstA [Sphingomonas fennica]